jgi:uncharacterized membrane protein YeaQ/YmgE (transglycosylase-associated protein family)
MGLLSWIVVGFIAGALASVFTGRKRSGCITTTFIGVVGGIVGGAAFNLAGSDGLSGFNLYSVFVAVIGATVLLVVWNKFSGKDR